MFREILALGALPLLRLLPLRCYRRSRNNEIYVYGKPLHAISRLFGIRPGRRIVSRGAPFGVVSSERE